MLRHIRVWVIVGTLVALLGVRVAAQSKPEGQLSIAFDTSIAATYSILPRRQEFRPPLCSSMPCMTRWSNRCPGTIWLPVWRSHGARALMG